jgi:(p)ppGpp synthase/HD superfamily hydrolase
MPVEQPAVDDRTVHAPWQDFDLVMAASAYAAQAHRDDVRKSTTIPYLSHLWSVAALVLEQGGDDRQVAAALLHDIVEDHGGAACLDEIRARFGDDVADLVAGLSDSLVDTTAGQPKAPWRERREQYLQHLATADERVALVSACDKLHNARCILADLRADGPAVWGRFTTSDPVD